MKKMLEFLLNVIHKEDIEILYGVGSKIEVNEISYSTNNKTYVVNLTSKVTNLNESIENYPQATNLILEESWKFLGLDTKPTIINSIENN